MHLSSTGILFDRNRLMTHRRFAIPYAGERTTPVIPKRKNAKRKPRFNHGLYRERNRIERLIDRLKQFRRVATGYEKRAENYLAMLMIGAILIWLK